MLRLSQLARKVKNLQIVKKVKILHEKGQMTI